MFISGTVVTTYLVGSCLFSGNQVFSYDDAKRKELSSNRINSYSYYLNTDLNNFADDFISNNQVNTAIVQLSEIENLPENWNDNGASAFSSKLISKCKDIVSKLYIVPKVYPVANDSIQLEYYKENGELLEFNIFEDKITMFKKVKKEDNQTWSKSGKILDFEEEILKEVEMFYAYI